MIKYILLLFYVRICLAVFNLDLKAQPETGAANYLQIYILVPLFIYMQELFICIVLTLKK